MSTTSSTSVIATKAAKAAAKIEANGVAVHSLEDLASHIGSSAPPPPKPSSVKKPVKEKEEDGDKTDNEEDPKKTEKKNGSKKGSKRKENPSTSTSTSTSAADAESKSTKTKKSSKKEKKVTEDDEEEEKLSLKEKLLRYRNGGKSETAAALIKAAEVLRVSITNATFVPIAGAPGITVPTSVIDGCNAFTENTMNGIWVQLTDAFTSVHSKFFKSESDLKVFETLLTNPTNKMLCAAFGAIIARDTQGVYYLNVEGFWSFHHHHKFPPKDAETKLVNETYIKSMYMVSMPAGANLLTETERLVKYFKDRAEAEEKENKKKGAEETKKKKATISARKQKALDNNLEWCDACDDLKMLCTCGSEQPAPKKQKKDTTAATTSAKPSDGKAEVAATTTTPSTATTSTSVAAAATADTPTSKDGDKSDADDDEDNADDK